MVLPDTGLTNLSDIISILVTNIAVKTIVRISSLKMPGFQSSLKFADADDGFHK